MLGSFGLVQWQRRRDRQASITVAKLAAYSELHARTFSFARRTDAFGLAKRLRSGISESLDISLRLRKPLDLFELYEWLDGDFRQLSDACSKICAIGSQEAIGAAYRLVALCGELMGAAIATDNQRSHVVRLIKGEAQTAEQAQSYQAVTLRLCKEREVLANLLRKETGHDPVVLPIHRSEAEMRGERVAGSSAVENGVNVAGSGSGAE
ncbi:MAG: hypothetical protein ACREUY_09850 [Burkholderiales bacterium]